jgi:hypothetical protein
VRVSGFQFSVLKRGRGWGFGYFPSSHLLVGIVTQEPNIWTRLLLDPNMGWGVCNCSIFNNFFTIGGNQLNASLLIEGFSSIQRAWQDFPWVSEISTWQPNKLSYFIDRHESSTLDKTCEIKAWYLWNNLRNTLRTLC